MGSPGNPPRALAPLARLVIIWDSLFRLCRVGQIVPLGSNTHIPQPGY